MAKVTTNEQAFQAANLILKHLRGEISKAESAALNRWLLQHPDNQGLLDALNNEHALNEELQFFQSIDLQGDRNILKDKLVVAKPVTLLHRLGKWKYAAMLLLTTSLVVSIYRHEKKVAINTAANSVIPARQDILPGGNKAILTLANGQNIVLNSVHKGLIANQGRVDIHKNKDGQVVYEEKETSSTGREVGYNTISTPSGGQYSVVLPDGSKVWLNSRTTLRFPTEFTGKERTVELTGEAYFEITKISSKSGASIKRMPFIVKANDVHIEVLGTHFNVMAYNDERTINTTLLEGSVKVSRGQHSEVMTPGQQASASGNGINVEDVDVNEAVAWKNGLFQFNNADLPSIMRQIERWYDVKIIYQDDFSSKHYSGVMARNNNVSALLKMLEMAGKFHFKIEGKEINVMK